jgi:hypothetical protein
VAWCPRAHGDPPARKVREYAEAVGFLVLGVLLVLGIGWLAFIVVWAAIAESS